MTGDFFRGMFIGAAAGAVAELLMLGCDRTTRRNAEHTMRNVTNAVDDAVDNISRAFR